MPNAEIMIHQPSGGMNAPAKASDIEIVSQHIENTKKRMNRLLAAHTGQTIEQIEKDTDRDYYLTEEEALEYGIIDEIIKK